MVSKARYPFDSRLHVGNHPFPSIPLLGPEKCPRPRPGTNKDRVATCAKAVAGRWQWQLYLG